MMVLPLMAMAFSMTGCSILKNLINGGGKSSSGEQSQQQSGSSSQQSGSSQQGGSSEFKMTKSGVGLSADAEGSTTFTVGSVDFVFNQGILCSNNYDEFGFKPNYTVTMKSKDATKKIKKIVFDNYKYYNDCPLVAGETGGSGNPGVATDGEENHKIVTWDNLDGAAYTYTSTYTGGNSWTWSITVTLG